MTEPGSQAALGTVYRGRCRCGYEVENADPNVMIATLNRHVARSACFFDWSAATNGRIPGYGR